VVDERADLAAQPVRHPELGVAAAFAGSLPVPGCGTRETRTTKLEVDYVRVWEAPRSSTVVQPADAVSDPPRAAPPAAPARRLLGTGSRRVGRSVRVAVFCPSGRCTATARATIRVPRVARATGRTIKPRAAAIGGAKVAFRIRVDRRARVAIGRALRAGRRVMLRLDIASRMASPRPARSPA